MNWNNLIQASLYHLVLLLAVKPLGIYMARIYEGSPAGLNVWFSSVEHSYAEHVAIVDALERGDARAAVRLMEDHLHNVERNLQLDPRMPDLHQVLRPVQ